MHSLPRASGAGQPLRTHKSTPISVHHRGRTITVGHVVEQTFVKRIQGSKHILRTPKAICLDAQTIIDAEQAGAVSVAITDTEAGRTYTATLELFKAKCFKVARGDGQQLGLTLNYWSIDGQQSEAERKAEQAAAKAEAASYQQPGLFAELERPSYMEAFK